MRHYSSALTSHITLIPQLVIAVSITPSPPVLAQGEPSPDPIVSGLAWSAKGENANDAFGSTVASAGDVDGDGFDDVIIGSGVIAEYGVPTIRRVEVYNGTAYGLLFEPSWVVHDERVDWYSGDATSAGDVNGDGYGDVIVGAAEENAGDMAEVYLGSPKGLQAAPVWTTLGEGSESGYGSEVASAGDVNGDGYDDILVAAPNYGSGAGKVYLYQGSPGGPEVEPAWTDYEDLFPNLFGTSIGSAGDVNGDGFDDVIIGGTTGGLTKAFLYLGSAAGLEADRVWTHEWEVRYLIDFTCIEVSTAGDVNGDGYSDVIVGLCTYNYPQGRADLFLGSPSGPGGVPDWSVAWELDQVDEGGAFGADLGPAGDTNGDGFSDVLIGAPSGAYDYGKVYLYLGSPSGLQTTYAWTAKGEEAPIGYHQSEFGGAVASAGDVNGNGIPDIIVGAPGFDDYRGKTYLYLGGEEGPTPPIHTPTDAPTEAPTENPTSDPATEPPAATPSPVATEAGPTASPRPANTPDDNNDEPAGCTCESGARPSGQSMVWILLVVVVRRQGRAHLV